MADHETELAEFLGALVPGEPLGFDDAGIRRHDAVRRLAPYPLTAPLEAAATELAGATSDAAAGGPEASRHHRFVRSIGERLGAQGGAFLMALVAHRAQYLLDPGWRAKRDTHVARLRAVGAAGSVTTGGPLVAYIERDWTGLYGWHH